MRRLLVILLAVLPLPLIAASGAGASSTLTIRVATTPHFGFSLGSCAQFRLSDKITSVEGATLGSIQARFQTFTPFADGSDAFTASYTFALNGGLIVTSVSGTETAPSGSTVTQSVTGTVIKATGLYAGMTGTISGGGPITFDASGVPHPNLTFVITLD